jgi:hypothetical protein
MGLSVMDCQVRYGGGLVKATGSPARLVGLTARADKRVGHAQ